MNDAAPVFSPPPLQPPRSGFVTALGWIVIVVSGLAVPISAISFLMVLAHSYGTSSATPMGFVTVVLGPPVALVAGIGLLRRRRWAWATILLVLALIVISNVWEMATAPTEPVMRIDATGVPTTTLPADFTMYFYLLPFVVVCVGIIAMLITKKVRAEFGIVASRVSMPAKAASTPAPKSAGSTTRQTEPTDRERGWRTGHRGRDFMYYEEWRDGAWHQIEVQGEMLMGPAHHVIYFDSPERWQRHPEWARGRRDEIIARIKSSFPEPEYEYQDDASPPPLRAAPKPLVALARPKEPASRWVAHWVIVVLFAGFAAGMFWMVNDDVKTGETLMPIKQATLRRTVSRDQEPEMFWFSIGLYSIAGLGASGFALWLIREAFRAGKK